MQIHYKLNNVACSTDSNGERLKNFKHIKVSSNCEPGIFSVAFGDLGTNLAIELTDDFTAFV